MLNTEYLLQLMEVHGKMSLGQLSVKSGISKSQLSRIIRGKRGMGTRTLKGLMKAFPDADIGVLFILP